MRKVVMMMVMLGSMLLMVSVTSYAATIALNSTDTTYKYDAWDDKSYIDNDVHTSTNAFATDFTADAISGDGHPGWEIHEENAGASNERDYVVSDGWVPYNSYDNRWEIEFALPGQVQSVELTYYWLIDNGAPDKHAMGVGYYDKNGTMQSLDESYNGSGIRTKEIPIANIAGLTSIKIFGYLRTTDQSQSGSYTRTMYQFFRTGSEMGNPFEVHITSLPEPATIGLLSLGTMGLLRRR